MKILYIGSGYVGVCSAAVSADSGHQTLAYDIDPKKVTALGSGDRNQIESFLFEEGLADLLVRNKERITFTADYTIVEKYLETVDAIFMCLPTPEIGETGASDLSFYNKAAERLAAGLAKRQKGSQEKYVVIINKSTVPIDMINKTAEIMSRFGVKNYGVVSNPEFLVEGKAIRGSLQPDRVVVGASSEQDFATMRKLYQRFYDSANVGYIEVTPEEAAAGKLLANFYLFNRLAVCFDVVGRTCERFPNIRFEQIRSILKGDPRIGSWGFYDSLYAGGSCFIKDARSLAHQLTGSGASAALVREVYEANGRQLANFLDRAETEIHFLWSGKTVALLGVAFKQDTNDIRNSPSLLLAAQLLAAGVKQLRVFDPAALDFFKTVFPPNSNVVYTISEKEALAGSEAVIIATDWPQFKNLGEILLSKESKPALLMDGRRMLQHEYNKFAEQGIDIIAVGSPFIKGKR